MEQEASIYKGLQAYRTFVGFKAAEWMMRDKNIDHPRTVGKLQCCQRVRVRPIAHGSNGLCVIAENTDTAKKSLKRLAFLTKGFIVEHPDFANYGMSQGT